MPANNDYPVINGVSPSWADIIVRATPLGGALIDLADITAVSSNATVEVGTEMRGGRPYKRTTGEISYEASITLYRSGLMRLKRALMALSPKRGNQALISLVPFLIDIQHTPPGSVEVFQRRLKGCRVMGDSYSDSQGTDPQVVEVSLSPIEIVDVIDGVEVALL